jgi:hypothetical protein
VFRKIFGTENEEGSGRGFFKGWKSCRMFCSVCVCTNGVLY